MNNTYQRIMLVTDGSSNSKAAEETAFNLARKYGAKVLIAATVRPPSFVSQVLNSNADDVFEMVVAGKEKRLQDISTRFSNGDIETEVKVLIGKSSHEIALKAVDWDADLVVRYQKGVRSRHFSLFGNTARNLMRVCPRPLLLVGNKPLENPRVLACINAEHDRQENQTILDEAMRISGPEQKLIALYCWEFCGGESLHEHLTDELYSGYLVEAEQNYQLVFQQFRDNFDLSAFKEGVRLERGDATTTIPSFCKKESVDVAVLSSAAQNHPLLRLLGSTLESVLDKIPCSLLVVKPAGFDSPVKAEETDPANPPA